MSIMSFIKSNRWLNKIIAPVYRLVINLSKLPLYGRIFRINWNRISEIKDLDCPKAWYFCVPTHPNLGDQAQACCIIKWLNENFSDYKIIEILHNGSIYYNNCFTNRIDTCLFKLVKKVIKDRDIIFFQSGYTMTDVHPYQKTYLKIIESFPNNRIVFFPQTILYEKKESKKRVRQIINNHNHMFILARDIISFKTAENLFAACRIELFPDIVTTQIGRYNFNNERTGILLCMRNDSEQYYTKKDIHNLKNKLSQYGSVELTDTTLDFDCLIPHGKMWEYILSIIMYYSEKKVIITDRYHGTIFSLIANTPVIVVQTTDHKVSTGVEWFKGVYDGAIFFADSLNKAYDLAIQIINKNETIHNSPYFDEKYYSNLKDIICRYPAI